MRNVAVVGVGQSEFASRRTDVDFGALLQEGVRRTLDDADIELREIDVFVLAQAPDALHGVAHPEQSMAGVLGAMDTQLVRVNTGGATGASAAQVGWWFVASGRADVALVIGAESMGDCTGGAQEVLNKIWEPAYEAALPLNTIVMSAFHAVRYMAAYGTSEEDYALIASRLRHNGTRNAKAHLRTEVSPDAVLNGPMLSWPIWRAMACPRSSGACGVLLAGEERARRLSGPKAWIRGIASKSNTYFMGDRMGNTEGNDHGSFDDLALAAAEAYSMAGINEPARQIDLVEPYVPFAVVEPAMLEALQLCERGQAARLAGEGMWDLDGRIPVSPSGGVLCTNPIAVSGLVRIAEAALQLRDRAGEHQVDGATTAMALGAGGSWQFHVAAVLSRSGA